MQLQSLKCPDCGGNLAIDLTNRDFIMCPYCGSHIAVNSNKSEHTKNININKNINVNKNIKIHKTNVNKDETESLGIKAEFIKFALIFCAFGGFWVWSFWNMHHGAEDWTQRKEEAISDGKIYVGHYSEFEGQDYETVLKTLEALGFTNIEEVEIKDMNPFNNGEVKSVSIAGDLTFGHDDFFDPDDKVIISHY